MQTLLGIKKTIRPLRHAAALLCAVLAGLGLNAGPAAAQVTGPLTPPYTSPPAPTPFQWPNFHSGGGPVPAAQFPVPPSAAAATYLTPLIDPLQSQLQGTPTELYGGSLTQIPSFLLGDYDPTRPPSGLTGGPGSNDVYYPNHFADGSFYGWDAPFSYVSRGIGTVTIDDSAPAPTATTSGFTVTGGFTAASASITTALTAPSYPSAGTATNNEYLRLPAATAGSAVWTLLEPFAGNYSVYFHIPNDLPDSNGLPEQRNTSVVYSITIRDASNNIVSKSFASASQTEANDTQFLAGPFLVAANGSVVVTLTRTIAAPFINNGADYLVADSMSLQPTAGDVQSAPTVITRDLYPTDFGSLTHPLQYWGIFVQPSTTYINSPSTSLIPSVAATENASPDTTVGDGVTGNILLKTGNTTTAVSQSNLPDPTRLIRQLVYFGRSDPAVAQSTLIDDNNPTRFTGPTGTPVTTTTTPTASTATNQEYLTYVPVVAASSVAVATWTIPVPTTSGTSNLFVSAHIPGTPTGTYSETRLSNVQYTVQVNAGPLIPATISQVTSGTDALVVLPTGPLSAAAGSTITVTMYDGNGTAAASPAGTVIVADSITVSTGTDQKGAIYCVDGFTGGVVWRYETPGSANGASAPVFNSPAIARINVLITPKIGAAPAVYANRLVVVVGDSNGLVYCLDAIGNGDGTSNVDVLAKDALGNPIPGQPVMVAQPAYGGVYGAVGAVPLAAGTLATTAALTAHVGTTGVYWIYRPDAGQPKYISGTGTGTVKPIDPTTDLPVPAAFNTASPAIFVDPTVFTDKTGALSTTAAANAITYIGNSNGVLYALNASGGARDGSSAADKFNVSQTGFNAAIPSAEPLWWFSLRGVGPNSGFNASSADIESAPAIYVHTVTTAGVTTYKPTVYIGSAHEMETTSNVGRLYALNGLYGPSFSNGHLSPVPTAANYAVPGSYNYNIGQVPQTDANDSADWTFPDANNTLNGTLAGFKHTSSTKLPRPALGNITGSPVVFTNIDETVNNPTRIYIAANSGQEYPSPARPDDTQTGRLWAVNLDGSVGSTTKGVIGTNTTTLADGVWSYPLANDPNDAAFDAVAEPYPAIGAFLRATPAIGFVQFPTTITNGDGNSYAHADASVTDIKGKSVPMLYVGTRGINDSALYAVDIDGGMATPYTTATNDQRTIYRQVSPDGSIYQSSPALVTNATNPTAPALPGNGGGVYAVAGNTLYDYSATPISNPFAPNANDSEAHPLIRENQAFVGFGPISSPALAGATVTDLINPTSAPTTFTTYPSDTTDWVYCGDSSSGFCRAITPKDASYGGIPIELNQIVPPGPTAPVTPILDASIQTFLVDPAKASQTSTSSGDAYAVGLAAQLPVYEWGQNAYVRFTNVAPPNPPDKITGKIDPTLFVHDTTEYTAADLANANNAPVPFYTSDGTTAETVTFNLSDFDVSGGVRLLDSGSVQPQIVTTPPDGFVIDTGTLPASFTNPTGVTNLVANNTHRYLGTYTYTIADGTARNNSPGARRRFSNVKQVVTEYDFVNALNDGDLNNLANYTVKGTAIIGGDATAQNLVSKYDPVSKTYSYIKAAAVDQPTFGILNPLGVRGGGVSVLGLPVAAVPVGDELGPFRYAAPPPTRTTTYSGAGVPTSGRTTGDEFTLQSLTNGNDTPLSAPPSSSGVTGDATSLPEVGNNGDPFGTATPPRPAVVFTSTQLIAHNTSSDNSDLNSNTVIAVQGGSDAAHSAAGVDGLKSSFLGGYGLNLFDRGALYNLGQVLRVKATVPTGSLFAPASGRDGLYWNSNYNLTNPDTTGHASVVNFLPWETPPTSYSISGNANGSRDYPDIAPGNTATSLITAPSGTGNGGDLTSNSITLSQGKGPIATRTVTGDRVRILVSVPRYQPPNQQLYQQTANLSYGSPANGVPPSGGLQYQQGGEIAPVTEAGVNQISKAEVFPMGYVTVKRFYVPSGTGFYSEQRPYRDVRIYTGVSIDMRTSIVNPTTDIGKAPAAFGVQTEADTTLNYFTPYTSAFQPYFKPLEIHNDGNVNLLNIHMDQKYVSTLNGVGVATLPLTSDAVDSLSYLNAFDANSVTGPKDAMGQRLDTASATMPLPGTTVPEQSYLIRTSLDTDLVQAYGRNPAIVGNVLSTNSSTVYPGATFHKPLVGSSQPSVLTVPDAPDTYVQGASLDSSPTPVLASPQVKSYPFVSLAFPFGTPVGTYRTQDPQSVYSLRLFEGLDVPNANNPATAYTTNPANILYPPQYNKAVGGIGAPSNTTPLPDAFQSGEPLSTVGTQLIGTVLEQRLTDGATPGAVPMIDSASAGTGTPAVSSPDFAPAAYRNPNASSPTGNISVYWTSGRNPSSYGIFGVNLPFTLDPSANTLGEGYFLPTNPSGNWWKSIAGYTGAALNPVLPIAAPGAGPVYSGLTIAEDPPTANSGIYSYPNQTRQYGFDVAVTTSATAPYSNTLYSYNVEAPTGQLSGALPITTDTTQVKYGVKGLSDSDSNFTNTLWAFWTGVTRGRTALYYNSLGSNGKWIPTSPALSTVGLLPIPAGLTSVTDASPIRMPMLPVNSKPVSAIDVTYSGTGPDGNSDLYVSRYQPGTTAATASQLSLVPFPPVAENLKQVSGGWYQARDAAWSRTGALNVFVSVNGTQTPLLYSAAGTPLFRSALYDKASGLLVLTGVPVPDGTGTPQPTTTNTVYVDAATGRIRFSPALLPATQNFTQIRATFSPLARRLTTDTRADTAPAAFLDQFQKPNDSPGLQPVTADRRWTIWRKSGVSNGVSSASLYYKTQRLTFILPNPIALNASGAPQLSAVTVQGTDVTNQVDVDYLQGRIYFPISTGAEGQTVSLTYTDTTNTVHNVAVDPLKQNTVQWQDEPQVNGNQAAVLPTDSASGLDAVLDTGVPLDTAINENNVTAFLDPFASATSAHKVWLFWNSTRNGTADIYSETIDPLFAPVTP